MTIGKNFIHLCNGKIFMLICQIIKMLIMKYTLVIKKGKDGFYIGQLKELPAVFTQGLSISELKENIADVLELYLEDMRANYHPQGEMIEEEEIVFA
jgi:predicted RNase H-like HicB family nuclease